MTFEAVTHTRTQKKKKTVHTIVALLYILSAINADDGSICSTKIYSVIFISLFLFIFTI